jgi:uncharacterized protein YndB with AHSA1/START domain/DNA-binding MarR family transcriptional regulator
MLATIGEPTRFRIIELLAERPRTVGEVAEALGALQPQTTKHLQALEALGVVRVHRLGRRRIARLDRGTFAQLAAYFTGLSATDPDDAELEAYETAIDAETNRIPTDDGSRVLRFERDLPASAAQVWDAWTNPALAAQWWAPRHFSVAAFELTPVVGTPIRIVLREGDSAEYESRGRVDEAVQNRRLVFDLAPVDRNGTALFHARHTLMIEGDDEASIVLIIDVTDVAPGAAPAVAGLEPGWRQLLDSLTALLRV